MVIYTSAPHFSETVFAAKVPWRHESAKRSGKYILNVRLRNHARVVSAFYERAVSPHYGRRDVMLRYLGCA